MASICPSAVANSIAFVSKSVMAMATIPVGASLKRRALGGNGSCGDSSIRQTSNARKFPWDQPFLPPAPAWDGASRALLRPGTSDAPVGHRLRTADPEHDFQPDYADTRAWFDRLDAAST
jgi:hypothetical protein